MAERWAVASGNSDSTSTWNGGTLPTADDDVYANGYNIIVNASTSWKTVRNTAGTTAVAGGNFTLSNGVTLTLTDSGNNVITGTATLILYAGISPNQATLVGNVIASATNLSAHGVNVAQTGTFNLIGNTTGGSAIGAIGVVWSNANVVVTGNCNAGSGSVSEGLRCQGTGTLVLNGNAVGSLSGAATHGVRFTNNGTATINGNVTGGAVSASNGVNWPVTSTLTINGNVTGGSASVAAGVLSASSGTVIVNGDVTGGTFSLAYGVRNAGTGTLTVNGKVISATAAGVEGATGAITRVQSLEVGENCIPPVVGKFEIIDLVSTNIIVRNSALETQNLTAGSPKSVFTPPSVFGGVA